MTSRENRFAAANAEGAHLRREGLRPAEVAVAWQTARGAHVLIPLDEGWVRAADGVALGQPRVALSR